MSFEIALTGLNAASSDLNVLGNNIANSATTGFKQSRAQFADIFAVGNLGTATNAIGQGVQLTSVAQQFTQGNLNFTNNPLDLAVSGQGFFRLSDNGTLAYTRAGQFHVDANGYVVNDKNQRLTGYQPDASGNLTGALGDLQISTANINPSATSTVNLQLNLNANAAIPTTTPFNHNDASTYNNSTSLTVYDSLGNSHLATMYYVRTGSNTWDTHLWLTQPDGTQTEVVPAGGAPGDPTQLTFDSSGALTSVTPPGSVAGSGAYTATTLNTGANPLALQLDYAGTTQYGSDFTVGSLSQDGYPTGRLSSVDVGQDGTVFGRFTNGQSRVLGGVALSNFNNPQGLHQLGNTTWQESADSGAALTGTAGTGTLGSIQSGALEDSNVNLSEQLVKLITAQRDFQANAQVIQTASAITQTIINIR